MDEALRNAHFSPSVLDTNYTHISIEKFTYTYTKEIRKEPRDGNRSRKFEHIGDDIHL